MYSSYSSGPEKGLPGFDTAPSEERNATPPSAAAGPEVLEQILQGGQKMRAAAAEGTETLLKALKAFEEELRQKQLHGVQRHGETST